ncbi:MAG: HlyC/CorC family transporter [Candidatus Aminicenantes bacterium]|nr:HlyC/CorC family transporter [Candidatus Aminicenantes bacterium]
MLLPAILLFFLFLLLSAFFSSSETAFIASNPYKLESLDKKGSRAARLIRKMMGDVNNLLATILVGNTLVNTAAASVATFIFVSFIPDKNKAVLLATVMTTSLILIFSEITPKTYATQNPIKLALIFARPVRFFIVIFYPLVQLFTSFSRLFFQSSSKKMKDLPQRLDQEEIKILLSAGIKGMSALRARMISGVLEIGSRSIREIMIPRPKVKAIEAGATLQEILDLIRNEGFSRFPVYRGRLDNIEGTIHAKDIISYLVDNKEIDITSVMRKPLFIPESASLEKALRQMQETKTHLAFVVDEFGNVEGIVTIEDIIEEIVGEITDEYDAVAEELIIQKEKNKYLVKGNASIKEVNQRIPLSIPAKGEYTTIAGFLLAQLGRIPNEGDVLTYRNYRFIVEKMNKRQISLLRIEKQTQDKK